MSLIKPKPVSSKSQYRINVTTTVLEDIKAYCKFAGFERTDDFFEGAALHVLAKDKDFQVWKKNTKGNIIAKEF